MGSPPASVKLRQPAGLSALATSYSPFFSGRGGVFLRQPRHFLKKLCRISAGCRYNPCCKNCSTDSNLPKNPNELFYLYPMICFPNAKINLGLRILSKREDGFHNIETIIYPVPLRDALEFLPAKSFQITISGFPLERQIKDNLIYKAWTLLSENFNLPPLRVHLHKAIPTTSGLGGGSADAAFFLRELNAYFNLNISIDKLKKLAGQLGSDCPFFIENRAVLASGRGEIFQTVDVSLRGKYILLTKPAVSISTPYAYSLVKPTRPETPLARVISQPIKQWKYLLQNDFEAQLFKMNPEIEVLKNKMYSLGAVYASMSGSGSAVFGIFDKPPILKNIEPNHYFWGKNL